MHAKQTARPAPNTKGPIQSHSHGRRGAPQDDEPPGRRFGGFRGGAPDAEPPESGFPPVSGAPTGETKETAREDQRASQRRREKGRA